MEDTGGIADFIGERRETPKAATEPATVEVSNLRLTCGAACCERSTTPRPFQLKTTMQGLEQNGNDATPGPQGQQWPEGTAQSLALRARAVDHK